MRMIAAFVMGLSLILSSLALAGAKGASHDIGTEIVICSGVGVTTITIGPDGQPIEKTEVCPDGYSILAASLKLPVLTPPAPRLLAVLAPRAETALVSRTELAPAARGPPALI